MAAVVNYSTQYVMPMNGETIDSLRISWQFNASPFCNEFVGLNSYDITHRRHLISLNRGGLAPKGV